MTKPSIFTKIINGEIPAHKIYEDNKVVAFLDNNPATKGHVLVVPRQQVDHIWDLDDKNYQYLWKVAKNIGQHMRQVIQSPRIGIMVEGFGVPHAHIHLIPLYDGSSMGRLPHTTVSEDEMAEIAQKLKM